ncbi:FGGY-family carbohydrate kinase [Rhabdobacter roseus]|uniref:Sugar (Pentulose or hexulose) kinase n=1 Tax=Rhabdobacter roseus TaxID=1655419 RepID=A0A840TT03_9BACT|nr:FGGY family carbohydrate kinase [Rhabdobacter roseus]MBB5282809.1 sugar (pentulose or hexulose) kinase [Rhabdobacter roseus]
MNVTAVFDIGRTNKKCALFDEKNNLVEEFNEVLPETLDPDGFPCEDISLLTAWVKDHWSALKSNDKYQIRAVNVAAYGASLVHLDAHDQVVTPLYSYLKPVPKDISAKFYSTYGDPVRIALQTASPVLGMLNSGMQLYWIKHTQPEVYARIKTTLHLPQYISFLLTGRKVSDFTSIGCHTALWSYEMMDYHEWVKEEGFHRVLAPMLAASSTLIHDGPSVIQSGFGLHDSSSALVPYRMAFKEPFILLSTGTWCINLNPFLSRPLTGDQLSRDCLHFMTPEGSGVKASRVFLGQEHEYQVARIAEYFRVAPDFYKTVAFNPAYLVADTPPFYPARMKGNGPFPDSPQEPWQVSAFASPEAAYHHLMVGLTEIEAASLQLIGVNEVPTLFVDGGFARNDIFTQLLARRFPNHQVYSAELPYATALGAALHVTRPQSFEFPGTIRQVIPQ